MMMKKLYIIVYEIKLGKTLTDKLQSPAAWVVAYCFACCRYLFYILLIKQIYPVLKENLDFFIFNLRFSSFVCFFLWIKGIWIPIYRTRN
jgi:hypothetical protein